jgi:hypothetical protein
MATGSAAHAGFAGGAAHGGLAGGAAQGGFARAEGPGFPHAGGAEFGHGGFAEPRGMREGGRERGERERGEHRFAGLAQNSPTVFYNGYGLYDTFGYSPYSFCPPYDPDIIGQDYSCWHPRKAKVRGTDQ